MRRTTPLIAGALLAGATFASVPADAAIRCTQIGPITTYPVCPSVCVAPPDVDPKDVIGTIRSIFPNCPA